MSHTPIPVSAIVDDLHRLGVRQGDALMLHASLRRIGAVEGGPSGVIDALDMAIGPEGTLMMVLGAVVEHEWVNSHPEDARPALLAGATPFDPLTAPVYPEVGYLAEVFRTRPGTRVTDNPSGRLAARGRLADTFVRNAPWNDYYGPDSPLHRLCQAGGRVLRMGANPDTTTVLHYAEYLAALPGARRVRRHYRVQGTDGPETRSVECLDDEHGIVDWSRGEGAEVADRDYFAAILHAYLGAGHGLRGQVGQADATLLDAAHLVAFGVDWMRAHLSP